jgi:hypothetical protein
MESDDALTLSGQLVLLEVFEEARACGDEASVDVCAAAAGRPQAVERTPEAREQLAPAPTQ